MSCAGVLLVDDTPKWVERLKEFAHQADLKVIGTAASPEEALEALKRLRPPIMILDMYLDGGSGMQVLEALNARPIQTEIVVLTGSPSEKLREACLQLGARFFLDKAFEISGLQAALKTLKAEAAG